MNPSAPDPAGAPRQLRPTEVKRLNREWRRASGTRLTLLLDSVAQPFNVGSIIRTAAAFSAGPIWLHQLTRSICPGLPVKLPSITWTGLLPVWKMGG